MAMPNPQYSTDHVLRDSRFHRGALKSDRKVERLIGGVKAAERKLREAKRVREEREDERTELLGTLARTDFELDEAIRDAESEVLRGVRRDRDSAAYKAVFPSGLTEIVRMRGEEESKAVDAILDGLELRFPEIAKRRGPELKRLAAETVAAEKAYEASSTAVERAFAAEVQARVDLIRVLDEDAAAILGVYPGEEARMRSFFRPNKKGERGKATAETK